VGYLNSDLAGRMGGERPLRYVDVDDEELQEYPSLAEAMADRGRIPIVLVGDEVKSPSGISIYWVEEQLAALGVEPFAAAVVKGGS
jgi:hypothetical protein